MEDIQIIDGVVYSIPAPLEPVAVTSDDVVALDEEIAICEGDVQIRKDGLMEAITYLQGLLDRRSKIVELDPTLEPQSV